MTSFVIYIDFRVLLYLTKLCQQKILFRVKGKAIPVTGRGDS
jgi:hypothetical protein